MLGFSSKIHKVGVLLIATFAAGCASVVPTYVPPERSGNSVVTVALNRGGVAYYANGEDCTDPKIFAPEHNPMLRADRSLVVPANKRIALNSIFVSGLSSCHVIVSMKLRPDTHYLLTGKMESEQCKVSVTDASNPASPISENIEFKQMVWGWDTCNPITEKKWFQ
jgi:hypothetical protein